MFGVDIKTALGCTMRLQYTAQYYTWRLQWILECTTLIFTKPGRRLPGELSGLCQHPQELCNRTRGWVVRRSWINSFHKTRCAWMYTIQLNWLSRVRSLLYGTKFVLLFKMWTPGAQSILCGQYCASARGVARHAWWGVESRFGRSSGS